MTPQRYDELLADASAFFQKAEAEVNSPVCESSPAARSVVRAEATVVRTVPAVHSRAESVQALRDQMRAREAQAHQAQQARELEQRLERERAQRAQRASVVAEIKGLIALYRVPLEALA